MGTLASVPPQRRFIKQTIYKDRPGCSGITDGEIAARVVHEVEDRTPRGFGKRRAFATSRGQRRKCDETQWIASRQQFCVSQSGGSL